jgi:hypothetical protein
MFPLAGRLDHQRPGQALARVSPELGLGERAPEMRADRAGKGRDARREADRQAKTEGALQGKIPIAPDFPTLPPDVLAAKDERGSCSTPTNSVAPRAAKR